MYFFATLFLQKVGESVGDDLPSHHDAFVAVVVARFLLFGFFKYFGLIFEFLQ
jgi:hypothetical protein